MENELNVLEEGMNNELIGSISEKTSKSKTAFVGITVATMGLLVLFRKKIGAKIVDIIVKKLTKKGYTVVNPVTDKDSENLFEDLDESN